MKTIIAEKPSVAKEIAHIVGADKREEGYMQGNGYYVTWAFGHLVQPAMPETYGMKGFHAENLPVIPDPFVLVPRQVKTENGYKADAGVLAQIKIIGKLFDSSERIIVATDVFVSLISQKYGKTNTKEYLAKKKDMKYNADEVQKSQIPSGLCG